MLQRFRNFTYKHALPASIVITVAFYLISMLLGKVFGLILPTTVASFANHIFKIIYPFGIVWLFGFSSSLGMKGFKKALILSSFWLAVQCASMFYQISEVTSDPSTVWKPWYLFILGIITVIGIGLSEEFFFRVTIGGILAKRYAHSVKGIWLVALVSGVLFGFVHIFNVFMGVGVGAAVVQSITNSCLGAFWGAVYLRSGNIWVLVFIHSLTDTTGLFASLFSEGVTQVDLVGSVSASSFVLGGICLLVMAFLLRPSKCKEILARLNEEKAVPCEDAIAESQNA